jgi:predicted NBD/HSP70 family sugar kinase
MDHFAGLDVSVKETSVCIVDDTGRIVREVRVASEPEALPHQAPAIKLKSVPNFRNLRQPSTALQAGRLATTYG